MLRFQTRSGAYTGTRNRAELIIYKHKRYELSPEYVYIIPPNTDFSTHLIAPFHQLYIHFTLGKPFDYVLPQVFIIPLTQSRKDMIDRCINTGKSGVSFDSQSASLFLHALIAEHLCAIPQESWRQKVYDGRVRKAHDMMDNKTAFIKINNQVLARAISMSVIDFIRLFTRETGVPPMNHFMNVKLSRAVLLLRHSELSIKSIADECGFFDRAHLSKAFKQKYHMGPAQYRRERLCSAVPQ